MNLNYQYALSQEIKGFKKNDIKREKIKDRKSAQVPFFKYSFLFLIL